MHRSPVLLFLLRRLQRDYHKLHITPPAMTTAAAKALPVLLDAAPGKGLAGAMGAPEAEELAGAPEPEVEGKGAPVPEG